MRVRRPAVEDRTSPEVPAVLDDLRRIVQTLRESSRAAETQLGVSGAQLFVLKALSAAPALSLNALAARTRTHQSTVSVVVKRLCERGLVARAGSALDARRVELALTAQGRQLLRKAPFAAQERLIAGVEALPAGQRRALALGLRRLTAAMQLEAGVPAMFFEEQSRRRARRGRRGAR